MGLAPELSDPLCLPPSIRSGLRGLLATDPGEGSAVTPAWLFVVMREKALAWSEVGVRVATDASSSSSAVQYR